ncbi:MAG: helix-turn-helix domain-containing protein [Acidobacteriota bacterium]
MHPPTDCLPELALPSEARQMLERWVHSPTAAHRLVIRIRIVLLLADGATGRATARALGVSRTTVDLWRRRFTQGGCEALARDKPGRGRKRKGTAPGPAAGI